MAAPAPAPAPPAPAQSQSQSQSQSPQSASAEMYKPPDAAEHVNRIYDISKNSYGALPQLPPAPAQAQSQSQSQYIPKDKPPTTPTNAPGLRGHARDLPQLPPQEIARDRLEARDMAKARALAETRDLAEAPGHKDIWYYQWLNTPSNTEVDTCTVLFNYVTRLCGEIKTDANAIIGGIQQVNSILVKNTKDAAVAFEKWVTGIDLKLGLSTESLEKIHEMLPVDELPDDVNRELIFFVVRTLTYQIGRRLVGHVQNAPPDDRNKVVQLISDVKAWNSAITDANPKVWDEDTKQKIKKDWDSFIEYASQQLESVDHPVATAAAAAAPGWGSRLLSGASKLGHDLVHSKSAARGVIKANETSQVLKKGFVNAVNDVPSKFQKWTARVRDLHLSTMGANVGSKGVVGVISSLMKMMRKKSPPADVTVCPAVKKQNKDAKDLRLLRVRLEECLNGSQSNDAPIRLHVVDAHRFAAQSYVSARREIEALLQSPKSERGNFVVMLQKKFERLALEELVDALNGATRCYERIKTKLDEKAINFEGVIEDVCELLWIQKRMWGQQTVHEGCFDAAFQFVVKQLEGREGMDEGELRRWMEADASKCLAQDADRDVNWKDIVGSTDCLHYLWGALVWGGMALKKPPPSQSGGDADPTDQALQQPQPQPQQQQQPQAKQQPPPTSAEDSELPMLLSSIQASILKHRQAVRDAQRLTMRAAGSVEFATTLVGDSDGDAMKRAFVDAVLMPFLKSITSRWDGDVKRYMTPLSDRHEDDGFLSGTERAVQRANAASVAPSPMERTMANLSGGNMLLLQAVKGVRLFAQIGAAFVAQKVFNESYVRKVFSEGADPPRLTSMLYLMASIDATVHLLLVILLVLASFAFKRDGNTFMIDDIFLTDMLVEFALSSLVFLVLGTLIADVMRRKAYFQYADQGQVVTAAYRSALLALCVVNFVVPYSMLLS